MLYDLRCITSSENPSWTFGIEGELADVINKFLETFDRNWACQRNLSLKQAEPCSLQSDEVYGMRCRAVAIAIGRAQSAPYRQVGEKKEHGLRILPQRVRHMRAIGLVKIYAIPACYRTKQKRLSSCRKRDATFTCLEIRPG